MIPKLYAVVLLATSALYADGDPYPLSERPAALTSDEYAEAAQIYVDMHPTDFHQFIQLVAELEARTHTASDTLKGYHDAKRMEAARLRRNHAAPEKVDCDKNRCE